LWAQEHNNNNVHHLVRGKFVGGSSGINYTALVHPSAEDIDNWGKHAEGWSWSTLDPYFRKSQSLQPDRSSEARPKYFSLDRDAHGSDGPIQTSWGPSIVPVERTLIEAMNEVAGTKPPHDPYSGDHVGFSQHLFTVDRRHGFPARSYATSGYFVPIADRPNLKLLTDANVVKVVLERVSDPPRAVGVLVSYAGKVTEIRTRREVIISASTIQSPRLLELSGIGSPENLAAAGVECLVPLPDVGENLIEHPATGIVYEMADGPENITLDSLFLDQAVLQAQLKRLTETHDGLMSGVFGPAGWVPYASHISAERLASSLKSATTSKGDHTERVRQLLSNTLSPCIEMMTLPAYFDIAAGHTNQSKVMPGAPPGRNACHGSLVSLMYPLSRGSTHIEKAEMSDPFATQPRIDPKLLSHEADVDALAAGLTLANRAYTSPLMSGRFKGRVHPPPEVDLEDPEQARAYVRQVVMMFNHNSGTCAMGRVVDKGLKVKGVQGLRVVDVSVFPDAISANPMATVYAVAERAADLIKEDIPSS
jgi:choline dehydrogenase-like flavoprotein